MDSVKNKTLKLALAAMFTAIMAVCSWISVPVGEVPVTLQTLGVFLAIGFLGGKWGTASVVVYVLLGAIGVPVFAGFQGGMGIILSSTGGYIVGFIASALVMWLFEKLFGNRTLALQIASMVVGLLVCYILGTVWFMVVYTKNVGAVGLGTVLGWCVGPFVIPDLVKIAAAAILVNRVKKYVPLFS